MTWPVDSTFLMAVQGRSGGADGMRCRLPQLENAAQRSEAARPVRRHERHQMVLLWSLGIKMRKKQEI